jgi:hypothetical protein
MILIDGFSFMRVYALILCKVMFIKYNKCLILLLSLCIIMVEATQLLVS